MLSASLNKTFPSFPLSFDYDTVTLTACKNISVALALLGLIGRSVIK